MSQHPSLRSKSKEAVHRSVLKRYERLKLLQEKEKWDEKQSIYGLPKLKIVKFKVKKEKSAEAKTAAEAGAVQPTEGAAPAQPGKTPAQGATQVKAPAKTEKKGKEDKK